MLHIHCMSCKFLNIMSSIIFSEFITLLISFGVKKKTGRCVLLNAVYRITSSIALKFINLTENYIITCKLVSLPCQILDLHLQAFKSEWLARGQHSVLFKWQLLHLVIL